MGVIETNGIVVIDTVTPHGLQAGQWVYVDGLVALNNGSSTNHCAPNGYFQVLSSPLTSTQFAIAVEATPAVGIQYFTGTPTVTASPSANAGNSPYLSEGIDRGLAVTETASFINQNLQTGHQYTLLQVGDSTVFPDESGWLVLGYGYDYMTAPVPYLGRAGLLALAIDPAFSFPINVPDGADVRLLDGRAAPTPTIGQFWLTASPAGRMAAESFVDFIVAAGYNIKKVVTYPSDVGLGNEGRPDNGAPKLSDIVQVFGGDSLDSEVPALRKES